MKKAKYHDWMHLLPILKRAYEAGEFVLLIGNKGTGKTHLVEAFAEAVGQELTSINFSLRTRESHMVGAVTLREGNTKFVEGLLVQSMRKGNIFYADEPNTAESDVLVRLDEPLDDRRQVTLKENSGEVVKAKEGWFVIASINPMTHAGTKELPPQILSRFPIRIYMDYPPTDVEKEIVKIHTGKDNGEIEKAIELASDLRRMAETADIYYSPSIRETIAFARMLGNGLEPREIAKLVFKNVYYQWGSVEPEKVEDLINSKWAR